VEIGSMKGPWRLTVRLMWKLSRLIGRSWVESAFDLSMPFSATAVAGSFELALLGLVFFAWSIMLSLFLLLAPSYVQLAELRSSCSYGSFGRRDLEGSASAAADAEPERLSRLGDLSEH
jgi:hypothetical protein